MTRIKICGITSVEQALACVDLGADALGVNLVAASPRSVDPATASRIAAAVGSRALVVAVVANLPLEHLRALRAETGVGCLQLHGDEAAEDVAALLPHAYKAVRIGAPSDVAVAESMPGRYVLVDAKVDGLLGGSGHSLDWSLVAALARKRRLALAGGLDSANVARAIDQVKPWCVDVASGVESTPRVKDMAKVAAFVDAVRRAAH